MVPNGLPFASIDWPLNFAFYARQNTWVPALVGVLNDGLYRNDRTFREKFPYVAQPNQGQEWNAGSSEDQTKPYTSGWSDNDNNSAE